MKFTQELVPAVFLKRYKRFLVDVELENQLITVYCPNTGSMKGCFAQNCDVLLSKSDNPKRKYKFTLEMTRPSGHWVGVNTGLTNALVKEALQNSVIAEIGPVDMIQPEVKVSKDSRLDFLLLKGNEKLYIEVKNCSLAEGNVAKFPDAVTTRGTKHLTELIRLKKEGHGAIIFYCVQRPDAEIFSPAWQIDDIYSKTLAEAAKAGVMILAYKAIVEPDRIEIRHGMPVKLDYFL